jgi:hypothetical protein
VISKNTSLKIDKDRFDGFDEKIRRENEEDNKKCVHDERRWNKLGSVSPGTGFLAKKWLRSEYMTSKHFVDRSAKSLDGKFVMRGSRRSQYILPADLNSITVF